MRHLISAPFLLLFAALSLSAQTATAQQSDAQQETCVARVNHLDVVIAAGSLGNDAAASSRRERLQSWPGRQWNRARGRPPACDSLTAITFLAQYLEIEETDGYCLSNDEEAGFLLVPGERNYRGRCRATACERVNMAMDETIETAGSIAGIVTGTQRPTSGIAGFAHSSGAMLLSGNAASVTAALGNVAAGVTTALSAPAVMTAAAVSVVAVGGAVYVCND